MCPLRSLVGGLLSGGLLDIDEPGWSLKGSCLTRAHQLPATLLLNKQRHVSPLFYNNAHMENANGWDVLVCCSAIVFVLGCLFPCLCLCFCVSLCVCVLYVFVCLSDWPVWAVQAMCAVPPCHLVDRPPWCIGLIPPMQVLNRWSTQGATNFDAETRTSHDIAGGTQKVSQTPPSLSGEKGQRVKEGDDCNCCNSTDLSLGFHDHDLSLTRCSTTQNTRVTCYKGCLRLHPFYNDKTIHLFSASFSATHG